MRNNQPSPKAILRAIEAIMPGLIRIAKKKLADKQNKYRSENE
jgi:hypothetical protein